MQTSIWIASLVLGIGGSLHCMGMCGPLALSVPFAGNKPGKGLRLFYYYTGKATAYGIQGALSGLFGKGLLLISWQQGLSVAAGLFIVALALFPALKTGKGVFLFQKQFAAVYDQLQHRPKFWHFPALGFLNGLLPCGLVYTALAVAAVSGDMLNGFVAMFLFGIANAPALVLLVLFKERFSPLIRKRLKPAAMILSITTGLLLVLRGLNLGIPYISPEFHDNHIVKSCCQKP